VIEWHFSLLFHFCVLLWNTNWRTKNRAGLGTRLWYMYMGL